VTGTDKTTRPDDPAGRLQALVRPLADISEAELRLELHLRAGPRFQCQSPDCRSYEDGPGKWDTCPSCGRKGYLCGSFKLDASSENYRKWEARTVAKYRRDFNANSEPEAVLEALEKWAAQYERWSNSKGNYPSSAGVVKAMREAGML